MKIVVVIPTYNERETIGELLEALEAELVLIPSHEMRVLVVDGNSPDGTAVLVGEKAEKYKNIDLLVEKEKRGLGMAYVAGMKHAIENLRADAIMEFDGDFQHDPKDIKRLVAELDNGYDYVIGSRYVSGGSIPAEWAFYRKFLSKFGSIFAKFVLELPTVDNTSGFKLARVKGFAEKLPLSEDKILSQHYAYKIHLLYEMYKLGAKIKEVPIKFLEREHGSSKSDLGDVFESLKVVLRLRLRDLWGWRFFKFGLVGFSGFLVNAGAFELLAFTFDVFRPAIAAIISGELSVLSNYTLNNSFTFTDRRAKSARDFFKKLAMFNFSAIFILALQGGMVRLGEFVSGGNDWIIRGFFLTSIILGLAINYVIYTKIIWRSKQNIGDDNGNQKNALRKIYYLVNARFPTEKAHGIQLAKMCEAFIEAGTEVEVVVPNRSNLTNAKEFYSLRTPLKITRLPVLPTYNYWGRMGFYIGSFSFMIIYRFYFWWKKIRGERFIIYTSDIDQFSFSWMPSIGVPIFCEVHEAKEKIPAFDKFFRRVEGLIVINRYIQDILLKNYPFLNHDDIIVYPNGVDLKDFVLSLDKYSARRALGIPADEKVALYVGQLYNWKGLSILPKTIENLKTEIKIYIVGGDKKQFEKNIEDKKFSSRIIFKGLKPYGEIPLWLAAADVLLLLGTRENPYSFFSTSPMKLFEYMASKRPILAARTPAIESIVSEGEVYFYEPDDAGSLVEKVSYILNNPDEAVVKAEAAYELSKKYEWSKRAGDILRFIENHD